MAAPELECGGSDWYDANAIPPEEGQRMNGGRPNCVKASEVYKARPLNGIWATPPFLHNASVPTLWDLLSSVAERPAHYCTGTRRFDPKKVGYETSCRDGDFELDNRDSRQPQHRPRVP